ncbi:MAG: hypothetical protein NVS9B15_09150 [Acidobacteriaceae bacterium]
MIAANSGFRNPSMPEAFLYTAANMIARNLLLMCCVGGALAQSVPSEATLHREHDAIFSTLLPLGQLADDAQTTAKLSAVRDELWTSSRRSDILRQLWTPFTDLRGFVAPCALPAAVNAAAGDFAALTRPEREEVFARLQACSVPDVRLAAANLRNLYVVKGYGAAQEQITGVHLNMFAPAAYIESHQPELPRTRLRYDALKDEIVSTDRPFDVLIVGSGPAGSVLAHELRAKDKHVLLIERGPLVIPGAIETRLDEELIDTRMSADGLIRIRNGNAVGGGTQVNVDLAFAPTSAAVSARIEAWRQQGRIRPDEFRPDEVAAAYEWVKAHIGTREVPASEMNANNRVLWEGATRAQLHPKLYALNTYPPNTSSSPVTDKRSAESQLLLEAMKDAKNPLSLLSDAEVTKVLFNEVDGKQHAYGVELRVREPVVGAGLLRDVNGLGLEPGRTVIVRAKTVILSAGALGSPTILMHSGVSNPNIGSGVVLHPSMPVMGRFEQRIDALAGTQASVYVDDELVTRGYAFEAMAAPPNYAAIMSPGTALHTYNMVKSFQNLAGFGVMLVDTSQAQNRVLVTRDGTFIDYTLSEEDKRRFRDGIGQAIRMMFLAGAKEVYLPTMESVLGDPHSFSVDAQVLTSAGQADAAAQHLQFTPGRTLLSSAHMQATDKMGRDASNSVVGTDFHVWGTTDLYVVDGSIFPTSIGASPMQSIYTIAKIFADHFQAALPAQ